MEFTGQLHSEAERTVVERAERDAEDFFRHRWSDMWMPINPEIEGIVPEASRSMVRGMQRAAEADLAELYCYGWEAKIVALFAEAGLFENAEY